MAHRKFISTGQLPLFDNNFSLNNNTAEGASVQISSRKIGLLGALSHYGSYRQLEGLCHATDPVTNHPARVQVIDRYGSSTEVVLDNSLNKVLKSLNQAKINFDHASGHYALIEAGFDEKEVKDLSRQLFEEFTSKYFINVDAKKQRAKFRRTLANSS